MMDIWKEISKYIPKGSWKNFVFTCKELQSLNTKKEINKRSNHLWTLIKMYPDKPWDWFHISKNSNITWEIVKDNPDKDWNWEGISGNKNLTWEIVRDTHDNDWHWDKLSFNTFNN